MPSPTFILVPGHWHTTAHYQPLITTLTSLGHTAKAVQLASVGLKSPRPTFPDDVRTIYDAVSQELRTGSDVCLVLHSYSGIPGAEALNQLIAKGMLSADGDASGKKGRLRRVVFIAALVAPAGVEWDAKTMIGPQFPGFSIDENGMCLMSEPGRYFFNDLSHSTAQPWVDALDQTYYMSSPCPLVSSEDWRGIPLTALLCRQDKVLSVELQDAMWQGMESESIDSGHTPYVSQPDKVAEILVRLADAVRDGAVRP